MLSRRSAAILAAISLAAFIGALVPMIARIRDFNATVGLTRFHAKVIPAREFKLVGFPLVRISDATDARGLSAIKVEYADRTHLLPVKAPPAPNVPSLDIYGDWLKVLAINEVIRDSRGENLAKPGSERLIIAIRETPEGFNPDTWGAVRRTEWVFDFYELTPAGDVQRSTFRWPRSKVSEKGLRDRNQSDNPSPRELALEKLPILKERTLEHFAAMHVIPKLSVPQHKFTDTALNPSVLGWTLPVAMLSFIGLVIGFVFALRISGKP